MSACQTRPCACGAEPNAPRPQADLGKGVAVPAPLPSTMVLRGHKSVSIEHEGVIYRLQVTKLGKLILTK